ncbi:hypothetical protein FHS42_000807 [Streptomyces zagrosensis]|uniref:Uncharacterized protein n=1 Tax=Streptomyces zagrosensis TaxID=1042984 RepID=A0A7W9UX10_9ACTN|nr:hypothetical protein [Streptomyces zagrosensis]
MARVLERCWNAEGVRVIVGWRPLLDRRLTIISHVYDVAKAGPVVIGSGLRRVRLAQQPAAGNRDTTHATTHH